MTEKKFLRSVRPLLFEMCADFFPRYEGKKLTREDLFDFTRDFAARSWDESPEVRQFYGDREKYENLLLARIEKGAQKIIGEGKADGTAV